MYKIILFILLSLIFVSCSTLNPKRPKDLNDLITLKDKGYWEIRNDAKNCFNEQKPNAIYVNSYYVDMRDANAFVLLYYQNKLLFKPSSFSYKIQTEEGNISRFLSIEKQDFGTLRYEIKGCTGRDFYPSDVPELYFYSVKIYNMK